MSLATLQLSLKCSANHISSEYIAQRDAIKVWSKILHQILHLERIKVSATAARPGSKLKVTLADYKLMCITMHCSCGEVV